MNSRIMPDIWRVGALLLLATAFLFASTPFALAVGEPSFAPWGMFAGLMLYGVALSHALRRLMFPYVDLKAVAADARRSPTGAGLVFIGVCIVLATFLSLTGSLVHAAELPAGAIKYIPVLKAEQATWWADMPAPATLAAQVEQETCVSLRSARCWSPRAELRTTRERGVGLGQITRTSRFDALAELRAGSGKALDGWAWDADSLYDPALQLRALVLKDRQGWQGAQGAATDRDRLAFTYAAYNGGLGGVLSDRRVCSATLGCDAGRWFGHVEHTSLKRKTAAAGYGQSFFQINRAYVRNVLDVRRPKYDREFL